MQEEYSLHTKLKDLSRQEKEKDIKEAVNSEDNLVAVYNLQAVLSTPASEVLDFYYKSKLATYNLTVFNIVSKQASKQVNYCINFGLYKNVAKHWDNY